MDELNIQKILEMMPHRYPMMMVDRIIDVSDDRIHCIKNVTINEPFFTGHFPDKPVMPGVLMLEGMAQAAGLLYLIKHNIQQRGEVIHYLASIDKARFKRLVIPGDQLHYHADVTHAKKSFWKLDCVAFVDDERACSAQITIAQKEYSS